MYKHKFQLTPHSSSNRSRLELENKDQKIKGSTKLLMVNLDITADRFQHQSVIRTSVGWISLARLHFMPFGPWVVCSASVPAIQEVVQLSCHSGCLSNTNAGFQAIWPALKSLSLVSKRHHFTLLEDQFINQWLVYKLVRFIIGLQHIRNQKDRTSCKYKLLSW